MKVIAVTNDLYPIEQLASIIFQIHDIVDYIHIREKSKTCADLIVLLQLLREKKVAMKKIVINDRMDVALLSNLSNIHLPSHSLPIKLVKEFRPSLTVGRSVHSVSEARNAQKDHADYVIYGHCFETNSKKGLTPRGINQLLEIKKSLSIPVYAIGGITPLHMQFLQDLKINGIAVMSGIFSSECPRTAAIEYKKGAAISYEI